MLIGVAIAAVLLLLLMITYFKINPFVTLMIVSVFLGVAAGMPFDKVLASIQAGLGNTLGFIAIVLGLGTMLGKMLEESGGAERIAKTLINLFGLKKVHWAMMIVAFIVGIPVFFQVGVVLLIPLVFTIAKETGISLLKVGLPLVAGLSIVHGLVPPHPAAMAAVDIFKADVGKTILYSLIVGLPAAALAGPLFASFISKRMRVVGVPEGFADQIKAGREDHEMPGFGITVFTILLPVILMLFATIADLTMDRTSQMFAILKFIGSPFMALLIALLFAFYSFGFSRNFNLTQIGKFCDQSLPAMASILMVIGGGGAFNKVLLDSGIGNEIAKMASTMGLSPIMLAWTIAAMIRVATGSSTVSMMTAAGIVAPLVANSAGVSKEIIVLAVGSGALVLSHVNDAGFWIVKEYFGMSVTETLKTWTVLETILSVSSLIFILLLSKVVA
ncbi:GntP family permease [Pelosinus baikalensis]|jgi:GntP family gluconate:H+ symporter|uniref:GntP family permease n=1 Tax=Pelosinus baikalensis TaxID=2892015 RepID=A0ABS8HM49_9FIRM|nr:GntP family permease [Pelosinus baikalensis]MCC5464250.1 GntP family permease [Pelosinus baikalensis]